MSLCRCSRCESHFYKEETSSSVCRYHTGQYRTWWSCCKDMRVGAPGCRSGSHVEDHSYTQMLDALCAPAAAPTVIIEGPNGCVSFAAVSLSPVCRQQQAASQQELTEATTTSTSAGREVAAAGDGRALPPPAPSALAPALAISDICQPAEAETLEESVREESAAAAGGSGTRTVPVPYVVGPHDTWPSICLKHRMTSEEMMRLNGLRHRRARVGDVLLVWSERSDAQQAEDWKRQLVRQFRRLSGCNAAEALYYLEQHDFRIGDALRERSHDHAFEAERAQLVRSIHDETAAAEAQAAEEAAHKAEEKIGRAHV